MQGTFIKIIFLGIYMNNNQKNLFSIGQIAESIGITRKIILNYETKGLIRFYKSVKYRCCFYSCGIVFRI